MKIFDGNNAMDILWELVAPLAGDIPIYKEVMNEDEDSVPESYLLIREDITNNGRIYGDGAAELRRTNCDLLLVSKCSGADSSDIHNVNRKKVDTLLKAAGISYNGFNLGYEKTLKEAQYSWSVTFIYG